MERTAGGGMWVCRRVRWLVAGAVDRRNGKIATVNGRAESAMVRLDGVTW